MNLDVKKVSTVAELENIFPILHALRPSIDLVYFKELFKEAQARDQYELVSFNIEGECVALMGYRILYDLVHGKHLYIDDLITKEGERSKGVGSQLLRYAEQEADRLDCNMLRLCTGLDNEGARKFYEREGWELKSVAYKKTLNLPSDTITAGNS